MPSMTQQPCQPALEARLAALEAERLAPVPRASHVVGVDVDDLALVVGYIATIAAASRRSPVAVMSGDVAVACQRLDAAVRAHSRSTA
jgi:hypothetical protein